MTLCHMIFILQNNTVNPAEQLKNMYVMSDNCGISGAQNA